MRRWGQLGSFQHCKGNNVYYIVDIHWPFDQMIAINQTHWLTIAKAIRPSFDGQTDFFSICIPQQCTTNDIQYSISHTFDKFKVPLKVEVSHTQLPPQTNYEHNLKILAQTIVASFIILSVVGTLKLNMKSTLRNRNLKFLAGYRSFYLLLAVPGHLLFTAPTTTGASRLLSIYRVSIGCVH